MLLWKSLSLLCIILHKLDFPNNLRNWLFPWLVLIIPQILFCISKSFLTNTHIYRRFITWVSIHVVLYDKKMFSFTLWKCRIKNCYFYWSKFPNEACLSCLRSCGKCNQEPWIRKSAQSMTAFGCGRSCCQSQMRVAVRYVRDRLLPVNKCTMLFWKRADGVLTHCTLLN